jgi:hypothetical protein
VSSFHRKANRNSQTVRVAIFQNVSRELWGRGAFGGLPAALAFVGNLDPAQEGTEFTTDVPYARNGHPEWAYWYRPEDGGDPRVLSRVEGQDSFACVPIEPVLNRYRCR